MRKPIMTVSTIILIIMMVAFAMETSEHDNVKSTSELANVNLSNNFNSSISTTFNRQDFDQLSAYEWGSRSPRQGSCSGTQVGQGICSFPLNGGYYRASGNRKVTGLYIDPKDLGGMGSGVIRFLYAGGHTKLISFRSDAGTSNFIWPPRHNGQNPIGFRFRVDNAAYGPTFARGYSIRFNMNWTEE